MTCLTTQIERDCPTLISDSVNAAAEAISLAGLAEVISLASGEVISLAGLDEEGLLDRAYVCLSSQYANSVYYVYRGGHHVAVCEGNRRLAMITAAR